MIRLALYQPDMPPNVGALLRLGACLGVPVHIIEPCGFPYSEKAVRRSALKALSAFPLKNAQRALVESVADKDPSVSYMAHRLLCEWTGRHDVAQKKDDWAQVVK